MGGNFREHLNLLYYLLFPFMLFICHYFLTFTFVFLYNSSMFPFSPSFAITIPVWFLYISFIFPCPYLRVSIICVNFPQICSMLLYSFSFPIIVFAFPSLQGNKGKRWATNGDKGGMQGNKRNIKEMQRTYKGNMAEIQGSINKVYRKYNG